MRFRLDSRNKPNNVSAAIAHEPATALMTNSSKSNVSVVAAVEMRPGAYTVEGEADRETALAGDVGFEDMLRAGELEALRLASADCPGTLDTLGLGLSRLMLAVTVDVGDTDGDEPSDSDADGDGCLDGDTDTVADADGRADGDGMTVTIGVTSAVFLIANSSMTLPVRVTKVPVSVSPLADMSMNSAPAVRVPRREPPFNTTFAGWSYVPESV